MRARVPVALVRAAALAALVGGAYAQVEDPQDGIRFGRAVCAIPDFDEDGVADFAVGAPLGPDGRSGHGSIFLYSGARPELQLAFDGPWARAAIGRRIQFVEMRGTWGALLVASERDGGAFLYSLEGELLHRFEPSLGEIDVVGDWNADGDADFAAETGGRLVVLSGRGFEPIVALPPSLSPPFLGTPGDIDGDGRGELLVRGGRAPESAVLVFSRNLSWLELRVPRRFPDSPARPAWTASAAGDLDGDGRRDLLVGLPGWGFPLGRVVAFSGCDGRAIVDRIHADWSDDAESRPEEFGFALIGGEDLNGDGLEEFVAGAPAASSVAPAGVYALSTSTIDPLWTMEGIDWDRSNAGTSFDWIDDRDGDGVRDLLVGGADAWDHGGVFPTGHVRILSGATGEELCSIAAPPQPGH